jgi:very-short-patch-repair endonuclease
MLDAPSPVAQYEVRDGTRLVARVDFAYPEARLAIEADGYRFHGTHRQWKKDLKRRTILAGLGWRVLHFSWEDVHDRPAWVREETERSLCADPHYVRK